MTTSRLEAHGAGHDGLAGKQGPAPAGEAAAALPAAPAGGLQLAEYYVQSILEESVRRRSALVLASSHVVTHGAWPLPPSTVQVRAATGQRQGGGS